MDVSKIIHLYRDQKIQEQLKRYGLFASRVSWLDSHRFTGSCWGKRITDMTLAIKHQVKSPLTSILHEDIYEPTTIIRDTTNFEDVVGIVNISDIMVPIRNSILLEEEKNVEGNVAENNTTMISLKDYLADIHKYSYSTLGENGSCNLLDGREGKEETVLFGSQAHILPFESKKDDKKLQFHIQLDTYNSKTLAILVTKEGTSSQIVEGGRIDLYLDAEGKKADLNIESVENRRSRDNTKPQGKVTSHKDLSKNEILENSIIVIRVPLKNTPQYNWNNIYESNYILGGTRGLMPQYSPISNVTRGAPVSNFSTANLDFIWNATRSAPEPESLTNATRGMDFGALDITITDEPFPKLSKIIKRDNENLIRIDNLIYRTTDTGDITELEMIAMRDQFKDSNSMILEKKSIHDMND